jgi:hypothetical protein
VRGRRPSTPIDLDDDEGGPAPPEITADNFSLGLGTWVENPEKWLARPGAGGSKASGLRNFSDYVRRLDVRRPDGSAAGKMRFGLWVEPEHFDPFFRGPEHISRKWGIIGATPVLDFSRSEVVDGITARLQRAITAYHVDYLKVDANLDLEGDRDRGRSGHFWTRWSAGLEQLYTNLRRANPGLYIEHCASGLKRYWIGMPRLAHSSWLDDDVEAANVQSLLDASDALLLPRQKTVLVVEDLTTGEGGEPRSADEIADLVARYAGADHQNGGAIGFSSRLELWSDEQQRAAGEAIQAWKQDLRGS